MIKFSRNIFFLFLIGLSSCGPETPVNDRPKMTKAQTDSLIIEMEKSYNKMEDDRIKSYISTHLPMEQTESGYWFAITK